MTIVEASVTIRPLTDEAFDTFVDVYGEELLPAIRKHGFDHIGGFKRSGDDSMNNLINLYRFDDLAALDKARKSMAADTSLAPLFSKLRELDITEVVKVGEPAAYSQPDTLAKAMEPRDKPRYYMQAVLRAGAYAMHPGFTEALTKLRTTLGGWGIDLTTAYLTTIGLRGEVTDLWAWEQPFGGEYRRSAGGEMGALIEEIRKYAPEERIYYLYPLPYSRMQ